MMEAEHFEFVALCLILGFAVLSAFYGQFTARPLHMRAVDEAGDLLLRFTTPGRRRWRIVCLGWLVILVPLQWWTLISAAEARPS